MNDIKELTLKVLQESIYANSGNEFTDAQINYFLSKRKKHVYKFEKYLEDITKDLAPDFLDFINKNKEVGQMI